MGLIRLLVGLVRLLLLGRSGVDLVEVLEAVVLVEARAECRKSEDGEQRERVKARTEAGHGRRKEARGRSLV